jgi:PAS domain S-box-containing protein
VSRGEQAFEDPGGEPWLLRGLLESAVHAIVVVDESGVIVVVNPATEQFFGYRRGS